MWNAIRRKGAYMRAAKQVDGPLGVGTIMGKAEMEGWRATQSPEDSVQCDVTLGFALPASGRRDETRRHNSVAATGPGTPDAVPYPTRHDSPRDRA